MRRAGKRLKAGVGSALRLGLGAPHSSDPGPRFQVRARAFGFKPGIDPGHLNRLVDELDVGAPA